MALYIKLQNGIGYLALNTDDSPAAAELDGWIDFIIDPQNKSERERFPLKAWIKRRGESTPWFALSCRGLTGVLRKETDKANAVIPHFAGHLGPNAELSVSAWICADDDGQHSLRLEVREADVSPETEPPGDDDSCGLNPDLENLIF
jgi:hypothetical protein